MESTKVIAQGKWIVEESVENLTSDVQHITIVKDESRGVIGKFINRISAVDARMIANAPNMVSALEDAYRSLSSVANGNYSRDDILCVMSVINRVINKAKTR